MKEMFYTKEHRFEILDTGYYFDLLYYIINFGTHPCAYVKIPATHWLYKMNDYTEMPIECHGGLTFCKDYLKINEQEKIDGKFIGWDYAHTGDYSPLLSEAFEIAGEVAEFDHKWTTEEIQKEVRDVCYQIKTLEETSPADKMFQDLGFEKMRDNNLEALYYSCERLLGDKFETTILFPKATKMVMKKINSRSGVGITIEELKAINKKCKELGWLDE